MWTDLLQTQHYLQRQILLERIFFQSCLNAKVKKIIHVSTDEVYGEKLSGSFKENDKPNPTNPYSASKAAAETIINSYKYHLKSNILIVRGNNIFGNRQYPEKLIPSCIYNVLKNKPIKLHGNGKNIRCYLSVYDFADAIYLLIKKIRLEPTILVIINILKI